MTRIRLIAGVSAAELIVAIIILGTLAAISLPRLGRAAPNATDHELCVQLRTLRLAIERYRQEHGANPGEADEYTSALEVSTRVVRQLTEWTDALGEPATQRDERHVYGPYLKHGVPGCAVYQPGAIEINDQPRGEISMRHAVRFAGWVYEPTTGRIRADTTRVDARGRRYDRY